MKNIFSTLSFILLISCSTTQSEITTIILVRHAEKVITEDQDPELTEKGSQRALLLAQVLEEVKIEAIYSTEFKRTLATVEPLLRNRNLSVINYKPKEFDLFATSLMSSHRGKTILISGHSNTTPRLVNALLAIDHPDLDESEYDWIYIVDLLEIGNGRVKKLKIKN